MSDSGSLHPPLRSSLLHDLFRYALRRFLRGEFDPPKFLQAAEPGLLASGELSRPRLDRLDRFGEGRTVAEMGDQFAIADRLQGRPAQVAEAVDEPAGLFDEPLLDHAIDAFLDSLVEFAPLPYEPEGATVG